MSIINITANRCGDMHNSNARYRVKRASSGSRCRAIAQSAEVIRYEVKGEGDGYSHQEEGGEGDVEKSLEHDGQRSGGHQKSQRFLIGRQGRSPSTLSGHCALHAESDAKDFKYEYERKKEVDTKCCVLRA